MKKSKDNSWWKKYFDRKSLLGYELPKKTQIEIRGVSQMLRLKPISKILDLCCGAGRHAIGLAALGYKVTGFDWSSQLLASAQEESKRRNIQLRLKQGDMRRLRYRNTFDAVINLFTSFGYFESESEDLSVLRGVHRALKKNGQFLIDVLNKEWLMRHFTPTFWQKTPEGDVIKAFNKLHFDPLTSRLENHRTLYDRTERSRKTFLRFKVYTLYDLTRLLITAGFHIEKVYGDFHLKPYGLDTFRTIIVAKKI